MSAILPKADIRTDDQDVRFVPKADILRGGKKLVIQSPRRRMRLDQPVSSAPELWLF